MPRNGSGTYDLPQAPFVPGTTIASSPVNSDLSDIGAALSQSISKDGQTSYTSNQPMGNNKLTGLAAGTAPTDSVNLGQVAAGTLNYGTATGTDTIAVTLSPGFTAYEAGQWFSFEVAATNTGAVTVNVNTIGAGALVWPDGSPLVAEDLIAGAIVGIEAKDATPIFHLQTGANVSTTQAAGNSTTKIATTGFVQTAIGTTPTPGLIYGLTSSSAGSVTSLTVAAGRATDSTFAALMVLGSTMAKTTSAWAAGTGNGGLDAGSIANSTWYHWYLISKVDGTTDVTFSANATTPTLPATYTLYRRIFSAQTDGSAQWVAFAQSADQFYRGNPGSADFTPGGTSTATLRTLSIPTGIIVRPMLAVFAQGVNNAASTVQVAPASNAALLSTIASNYEGSALEGSSSASISDGPPSNTSGQIYVAVPSITSTITLSAVGWSDTRGQFG